MNEEASAMQHEQIPHVVAVKDGYEANGGEVKCRACSINWWCKKSDIIIIGIATHSGSPQAAVRYCSRWLVGDQASMEYHDLQKCAPLTLSVKGATQTHLNQSLFNAHSCF
jgi:hypothetical protein